MSDQRVGDEWPPVTGLVLAGGRSRRFGRDKAGIEVDGQALLARTWRLVRGYCQSVFVSVRADQVDEALRRRYDLIVDTLAEHGPAAGLLAAHARYPGAAWFVTACDMPLLDKESIHLLIESRRAEKAATCYRNPIHGFPEPLCAIWEPATLERFCKRVESGGDPSPRNMLATADIELIDAADARALTNVNTPADLDRLGRGGSGR